MKVIATKLGYFGKLRQPGDEFEVPAEKLSKLWHEVIGGKEKAADAETMTVTVPVKGKAGAAEPTAAEKRAAAAAERKAAKEAAKVSEKESEEQADGEQGGTAATGAPEIVDQEA